LESEERLHKCNSKNLPGLTLRALRHVPSERCDALISYEDPPLDPAPRFDGFIASRLIELNGSAAMIVMRDLIGKKLLNGDGSTNNV